MKAEVVRMEHITRSHSGVKVLDDFRLNVYKGEILGIIGLSGAGKTAVSNILAGLDTIDEGTIFFNEQPVIGHNVNIGKRFKIFTIRNKGMLIPQLSIAENIFIIKKNSFKKLLINQKAINQQAKLILSEVGIDIPPQTRARELSHAQQHLVELAKAVAVGANLIVLDDITDSYTLRETSMLKETIGKLKSKGFTFLFESHRPDELIDFSDRITIMRDGRNVKTLYSGEYDKNNILSLMVGSEFKERFERADTLTEEVVLEVMNLCSDKIHDISFKLHKGEILGILDLTNRANVEIYNLLSGAVQPAAGNILLDGSRIYIRNLSQAISRGIGLVPEGANNTALLQNMSYAENLVFLLLKKMSGHFMYINKRTTDFIAREYSRMLEIGEEYRNTPIHAFDASIKQKIMLHRWLLYHPKILVCANLGKRVDVLSRKISYEFINEAAKKGIGVLLATSDLTEAANVCDRVIIISEKVAKGEFTKDQVLKTGHLF